MNTKPKIVHWIDNLHIIGMEKMIPIPYIPSRGARCKVQLFISTTWFLKTTPTVVMETLLNIPPINITCMRSQERGSSVTNNKSDNKLQEIVGDNVLEMTLNDHLHLSIY